MAKAKAPTKSDKVAPLAGSYDLVLKGGRVIDPAQGLDGSYDIAIRKGKIAAVAPPIAADRKTKTLDMRGGVVTPGLIDTHAHLYEPLARGFRVNPDPVGGGSG